VILRHRLARSTGIATSADGCDVRLDAPMRVLAAHAGESKRRRAKLDAVAVLQAP
jgi:hypothetical protein